MSVRKVQKVAFTSDQVSYFFPEDGGYLEPDDNEQTYQISQKEIVKAVDISSAAKHFDLNLAHLGPYKVDYFRNGRNLLLGGKNGHVAAIDWITKDLTCEFNVRESVHAVQWLHMPNMFAVAQADWTYVYDDKGTQIHCLKRLHQVYELEFLPYHFLLVAASDNGFLSWLDISVGDLVANIRMKSSPRISALTQNPTNAITITGHPNGSVRMWSPNVNEPLVQLLCHPTAVRDIAVDKRGQLMVTTGADRTVRVWDVRNYKCLNSFKLRSTPSKVSLSQRNLLAISSGEFIEVYKNFTTKIDKPYLRHRLESRGSIISSIQFCPYEDILGIGHQSGFTSIIVPGAGEANFDAMEANPYMSRSQHREMEVKALLDKVSHELITLDPDFLAKVADKKRAPNKYREVMKSAESRSKKSITPVAADNEEMDESNVPVVSFEDDHRNSKKAVKNKKVISLDNFHEGKRGKKKMYQRNRAIAAKKEEGRRRLAKQGAMNNKRQQTKSNNSNSKNNNKKQATTPTK